MNYNCSFSESDYDLKLKNFAFLIQRASHTLRRSCIGRTRSRRTRGSTWRSCWNSTGAPEVTRSPRRRRSSTTARLGPGPGPAVEPRTLGGLFCTRPTGCITPAGCWRPTTAREYKGKVRGNGVRPRLLWMYLVQTSRGQEVRWNRPYRSTAQRKGPGWIWDYRRMQTGIERLRGEVNDRRIQRATRKISTLRTSKFPPLRPIRTVAEVDSDRQRSPTRILLGREGMEEMKPQSKRGSYKWRRHS